MHTGGTGNLTVTGTTFARNTSLGAGGAGADVYILAFAFAGRHRHGYRRISAATRCSRTIRRSRRGVAPDSSTNPSPRTSRTRRSRTTPPTTAAARSTSPEATWCSTARAARSR
jgi:hypothetical protein